MREPARKTVPRAWPVLPAPRPASRPARRPAHTRVRRTGHTPATGSLLRAISRRQRASWASSGPRHSVSGLLSACSPFLFSPRGESTGAAPIVSAIDVPSETTQAICRLVVALHARVARHRNALVAFRHSQAMTAGYHAGAAAEGRWGGQGAADNPNGINVREGTVLAQHS